MDGWMDGRTDGRTDSMQLFHTFLCNSQNYQRPQAEGNSALGHPKHRGVIILTVTQTGIK